MTNEKALEMIARLKGVQTLIEQELDTIDRKTKLDEIAYILDILSQFYEKYQSNLDSFFLCAKIFTSDRQNDIASTYHMFLDKPHCPIQEGLDAYRNRSKIAMDALGIVASYLPHFMNNCQETRIAEKMFIALFLCIKNHNTKDLPKSQKLLQEYMDAYFYQITEEPDTLVVIQ